MPEVVLGLCCWFFIVGLEWANMALCRRWHHLVFLLEIFWVVAVVVDLSADLEWCE